MRAMTEYLFQLIAKPVEDWGLVVWYEPALACAQAAAVKGAQGPPSFCHPGSVSGPFRPPTGTTSWKASTNGPSSASNFVGRGW
jgi:hypothetical protein